MNAAVVDENVPIVANDTVRISGDLAPLAPQADDVCRLAVVRKLRELVRNGIAVIDDAGEVMRKYRRYLNGKGQPGVGDAFLKHIADHEYNVSKVIRVALERDGDGNYAEFPADPTLSSFDPSDRIFVALALSAPKTTTLLNAVDSDYSQHRVPREKYGVRIEELCPGNLKQSSRA